METQLKLDLLLLFLAGALVFFMQAGFAMLEGGMVRAKNSVNVIMKNFNDQCFGSLSYWMIGFGLMFGSNPTGWWGTTGFFFGADAFSPGVTNLEFAKLFYQTMFAATAATIVSGALAERIRYSAYLCASVFVTGFIYPVFGSWVWGSFDPNTPGWLLSMGYVDFAGSSVVHATGGWCALAGILAVGPRLGRFSGEGQARNIPGHNLALVALGGFILWFGWFGFNGGSVIGTDLEIGRVLINTHLAGSAGAVGAFMACMIARRPVLLTMVVNGGIGGLVGITAGAATMDPLFAVLTGFLAGGLVLLAADFSDYMQWDDVVGAVGVHGFCGTWGVLAAGIFFYGDMFNLHRIGVQALGAAACFLWAFPTAWLTFRLIGAVTPLRVSTRDEQRGLDYVEHKELGYPEFQETALQGRGALTHE